MCIGNHDVIFFNDPDSRDAFEIGTLYAKLTKKKLEKLKYTIPGFQNLPDTLYKGEVSFSKAFADIIIPEDFLYVHDDRLLCRYQWAIEDGCYVLGRPSANNTKHPQEGIIIKSSEDAKYFYTFQESIIYFDIPQCNVIVVSENYIKPITMFDKIYNYNEFSLYKKEQ
jgi:hypothetical protein